MMMKNMRVILWYISGVSAVKMFSHQNQEHVADDVKAALAKITNSPFDLNATIAVCSDLRTLSQKGKEYEPDAPYNRGKLTPTEFLEAGGVEAWAVAILNIMNNTKESEDAIFNAAKTCFDKLSVSVIVQNHAEKALAMHHNSPHVWDAAVTYYKKYWKSKPSLTKGVCFFAGFFGTFPGSDAPASALAKAGGAELLLDILDASHSDAALMQGALCALSDNVQGSKAFADIMVSHNSVQRFVDAVKATHSMESFHESHGFGLRYEVLEDIVGMLKWDDENRAYAKAFAKAGLMDAVIEFMPDDANDLNFQEHCCQVFNYLTNDNQEMQRKLSKSHGITYVKKVATLECAPDCKWPGATQAAYGATTPPPSCKFTLSNYNGGFNQTWYGER